MRKNNKIRFLAVFMVLTMLLGSVPVSAAGEELMIGSVEELREFVAKCSDDVYSDGLSVILTNDIDITGYEISIPLFLGTFDGSGHRIYGLSLPGNLSQIGLFGRIGSGAVVKNLTVEGSVTPEGNQSSVGGIAGINEGMIMDCHFSGTVTAKEDVGGIAGRNEDGGVIRGCRTEGNVHGTTFTGGITGTNEGTVISCTNEASVNTKLSQENANLQDEISDLQEEADTWKADTGSSKNSSDVTDAGGIVGYSTGEIRDCVNDGSVGYPHVGYNVGGIVGRQNGLVSGCSSYGRIQGRKDVGGIVGQMCPDITLQFDDNGMEELQSELASLQDSISRMLEDTQSASDNVTERLTRVSGYAQSARESASAIGSDVVDTVRTDVDEVNRTEQLVSEYIGKASPIMQSLADASGEASRSVQTLKDLTVNLAGAESYTREILSLLETFCGDLTQASQAVDSAVSSLEQALDAMSGDNGEKPDLGPLKEDLKKQQEALEELQGALEQAESEWKESSSLTPETAERLLNAAVDALRCSVNVQKDAADILMGINWAGIAENLNQAVSALYDSMDSFRQAAVLLGDASEQLRQVLMILADRQPEVETDRKLLEDSLGSMSSALSSLQDAFTSATQWVSDLSGEKAPSISAPGSTVDTSASDLNTALTGIGNELSALGSELSVSNSSVLAEAQAVNRQFMNVMNLFLNMLNSTTDVDYTNVFEDVSEESLHSAVRGKAESCRNYGSVSADRNAGGIAGAMAIEYDYDPEDDWMMSDEASLHFTYQTRAILLDCSNYGTIAAKKSCAGGVSGRMDIGTISGCGGYGNVSSEGSDYVGGVSGLSRSSIRNSYAKASLSGGRYIGGIAGSGENISGCIVMVEITDSTQAAGAIAGEISGEYEDNRFVSDTLAGVDRISYKGKAEKISYEELQAIEGIPEEFLELKLSFVADGVTVKETTFAYGESFGADIFPMIPEKDGCYIQWDKSGDDLKNLTCDTRVTASYEPYVTTLASEEESEGKPLFLVQGQFRDGDEITVEDVKTSGQDKGTVTECRSIRIPADPADTHTVRWHIPEESKGGYTVYTDTGIGWEKADSETNGSYLCFTMRESGKILITEEGKISSVIKIVGIVLFAAAAAGVAIVVSSRRKSKKKAVKETKKD